MSLNEKFLIPLNFEEVCAPLFNREILCHKNIAPWVKRTGKRLLRVPSISGQNHSRLNKIFGVYINAEKHVLTMWLALSRFCLLQWNQWCC